MSKKLLKSGLIVSSMTLISRVLGLIRDMVLANLMGASASADAFLVANKIPNFLRRLFAEGAFAQAFVPVLTEVNNSGDKDELRRFISLAAGTLGTLVLLVTILGVLGSSVLMALFGAGWFVSYLQGGEMDAQFELASFMLKITFPYLFFISLTALSGAILNTLNKFAVAAFTPVLLNVAIIGAALFLSPNLQEPAVGLAWGVFIGGLVQLLFQLPFLYRAGVLVKPKWGWRDSNVSKVRVLMIPALFGVSVSQINLLLDTMIATFLDQNSVSYLYYSDRLLEFPLGLIGIAIATVILPALSKNHVQQDASEFKSNMDWAVKTVGLLGIPAAAGLIVLAEPLLTVLFERGKFTPEAAQMASFSLMAYGAGLFSFMLIKVLAPGFYSRQDTKTPVKIGIIAMVSNMVFNLILAWPFGYVGLAMATSLSATLNALLLYKTLHQNDFYKISGSTLFFLAKVLFSTFCMVGVLIYLLPNRDLWGQWSEAYRVGQLAILVGAGIITLCIGALLTGIRPHQLLKHR